MRDGEYVHLPDGVKYVTWLKREPKDPELVEVKRAKARGRFRKRTKAIVGTVLAAAAFALVPFLMKVVGRQVKSGSEGTVDSVAPELVVQYKKDPVDSGELGETASAGVLTGGGIEPLGGPQEGEAAAPVQESHTEKPSEASKEKSEEEEKPDLSAEEARDEAQGPPAPKEPEETSAEDIEPHPSVEETQGAAVPQQAADETAEQVFEKVQKAVKWVKESTDTIDEYGPEEAMISLTHRQKFFSKGVDINLLAYFRSLTHEWDGLVAAEQLEQRLVPLFRRLLEEGFNLGDRPTMRFKQPTFLVDSFVLGGPETGELSVTISGVQRVQAEPQGAAGTAVGEGSGATQ